jgi:hypothetical protein
MGILGGYRKFVPCGCGVQQGIIDTGARSTPKLIEQNTRLFRDFDSPKTRVGMIDERDKQTERAV